MIVSIIVCVGDASLECEELEFGIRNIAPFRKKVNISANMIVRNMGLAPNVF